jgi:hypothetical protein
VPSSSRDRDLQTAAFSLLERAPCVIGNIPNPRPHEKPRLEWQKEVGHAERPAVLTLEIDRVVALE